MAEATKAKNRTRAAKALHEKKSEDRRADAQLTKAAYLKEKDSIVLQDVLEKAQSFAKYHTKMAQDGVGVRQTGHKLEDGQPDMETVYYSNEKRVSELDKAAGILELVDYIERQLTPPKPVEQPKAE